MFKKLPIILFSVVLLLFVHTASVFAVGEAPALDSSALTSPNLPTSSSIILKTAAEDPAPVTLGDSEQRVDGEWYPDSTVTFVGKTASRSGDFLDWTLRNYDWACVTRGENGVCSNQGNPLVGFWALIRNIVYALLLVVVLAAAFIMIITRGRNITITRFIPRFIFIIVLVTMSYAIIQFIYQVTDIVTGFFLRADGVLISTRDLIFIGFNYKTFAGIKRFGEQYDEAAFITLLLVRLTAITYYVMTGVLLVRKIILWFFIILSPVFPLLLFFKTIRNTGKIWIGEFFRWLLYAPLFAIFLHGLVVLWRSGTTEKAGIPLAFDFVSTGRIPGVEADIIYPTAVNILIGGPGQRIGPANSVNLQDTFALYVVSLLMLWVVIILPFILLKIFLDYVGGLSLQDSPVLKRALDRGSQFIPKGRPPVGSPPPVPPAPQGAGRAMQLPIGAARTISQTNMYRSTVSTPANTHILQMANLSVPKMTDIAKFETSRLSKNTSKTQEVSRIKTSLDRISNPSTVASPSERQRYTQVRQELISEKQKGNVLASNILSAANTTNQKGPASLTAPNLPAVNKVQQVSIEDYEEVRKMWLDTYQNAQPPTDLSGKKSTREEWVKGDIDKINQAVSLLSSVDQTRVKEGMDMVSNILPFLMIGGFSKTEVIAYLKAKLEAAKESIAVAGKKGEEEDTLLDTKSTATQAEKHMSTQTEAELPTEDHGASKIDELRKTGI